MSWGTGRIVIPREEESGEADNKEGGWYCPHTQAARSMDKITTGVLNLVDVHDFMCG